MEYKEYDVDEQLQPFVKCFWSLDAPATEIGQRQRIIPDGCMEMIIHYGDLYEQFLEDGSGIIQPRCFVFGQITTPLEIAPTGVSVIIAARFQPDGFFPFTNFPLEKMENKAVPLNKLFGDAAEAFEIKILDSKNTEERIGIITDFLLTRLDNPEARNRITAASIELLMETKGLLNVEELSSHLQVNRRQLERNFSTAIGLSPKQLSKAIRLQASLKMMQQNKQDNLTSLALENGYYDQAHFIKDFKEFTGLSPKQFYADNLKMSALFSGTD